MKYADLECEKQFQEVNAVPLFDHIRLHWKECRSISKIFKNVIIVHSNHNMHDMRFHVYKRDMIIHNINYVLWLWIQNVVTLVVLHGKS